MRYLSPGEHNYDLLRQLRCDRSQLDAYQELLLPGGNRNINRAISQT